MPSTHLLPVAPLLLSLAALATAQVPTAPPDASASARQQQTLPEIPTAAIPPQTPDSSVAQAPDSPANPAASASPAPPDSNTVNAHTGIRIVRLSQAKGVVAMDRGMGSTDIPDHRFEPAFDNLPVVQGAQIRTGEGVAEVEFEDNTTLRLAPETLVRFTALSRSPAGSTTSVIEVVHGMVYATQVKTKGNLFALAFGTRRAVLEPGTHIKLQVDSPATHLTVLDGVAQVESPTGTLSVGKKHGLLVADNPQTGVQTATLTGKDTYNTTFDAWDKQSASFHQGISNVSAYTGSGSGSGLYGLNDMNYYGSFQNMGSCGSMWQPYFAGAGWNPYSYGVFAYYPGAGYSFVSPYPWGWTPFHSGSWQQCGASGWGWRPGGAGFVGLTNTGLLNGTSTRPPLLPPHRGQPGLTVVSSRPVVISTATRDGAFVFNKDSAGLGIPRQSFGKLAGTSKLVAEHGSANVALAPAEISGSHGPATPAHTALVGSLHPTAASTVSSGTHPVAAYPAGNASGYSTPASISQSPATSRGPSAPSTSAPSASHGGGAAPSAVGGGSHH